MPLPCATAPEPRQTTRQRRELDPTAAMSGPQSLEEQITASLMAIRRILAAGRIPPVNVPPHQLTGDALIDFWADDLTLEQDEQ